MMKFAQLIEFETSRIDDFHAELDAWMRTTEGRRIPHRAVLRRDRDRDHVYVLMVEFASHDTAMENSSRPETAAFAAFLGEISEGPLEFRNLDVLREEDL
jgi:quinol monooxygenase YgiN